MKIFVVAIIAALPICGASAQSLGEASKLILEGRTRSVRVELKDELAAQVRKATKSPSPVYAQISAIKDFPEPTCKRLKVVITAPEAMVANAAGQQAPFTYELEMNLCANGYPPTRQ